MRFRCIPGCTECCRQRGFVYLTEDDIAAAAAHTGMTPAAFERRYVYRTRRLRRFRKPRGSQCPFLLPAGCALHPDKPEQCRTFPFWPDILSGELDAAYCPGLDAKEASSAAARQDFVTPEGA